jgi:anti-sigma factor RsiW
MQHPDEGMIHSWLDGALSAEEAARVESHVSECASCAAAVAEARGFIAASSRILTALDDVPRGVVPAVPAKQRDFRIVWRAAAAMLIVAGGSFVVMREGGSDARVATGREAVTSGVLEKGTLTATPTSQSPAADAAESVPQPPTTSAAAAAGTTIRPSTPTASPVVPERRAESPRQRDMSARSDPGRATQSGGVVAGSTGSAGVATAPTALRMQMREAAPESDATPLKVVRIERSAGTRRTIYEIAPSATVTLTEPEPVPLSAIVATGTGAAANSATQQRSNARGARTAQPLSAEVAKAPPPPPPSPIMDSRLGADSSAPAELGAAAKMAFTAVPNTISWTEPKTGRTLTLSGNVSVERLQEIRKRIEKERASPGEKLP